MSIGAEQTAGFRGWVANALMYLYLSALHPHFLLQKKPHEAEHLASLAMPSSLFAGSGM